MIQTQRFWYHDVLESEKYCGLCIVFRSKNLIFQIFFVHSPNCEKNVTRWNDAPANVGFANASGIVLAFGKLLIYLIDSSEQRINIFE